jgi:hypothetical protein
MHSGDERLAAWSIGPVSATCLSPGILPHRQAPSLGCRSDISQEDGVPPQRLWLTLAVVMLLAVVTACGRPAASATATPGARSALASPRSLKLPVLLSLHPDRTVLGQTFNEQPDGQSAIAVRARNVSNASSIVFNGTVL